MKFMETSLNAKTGTADSRTIRVHSIEANDPVHSNPRLHILMGLTAARILNCYGYVNTVVGHICRWRVLAVVCIPARARGQGSPGRVPRAAAAATRLHLARGRDRMIV